jgi:hypothetical protein
MSGFCEPVEVIGVTSDGVRILTPVKGGGRYAPDEWRGTIADVIGVPKTMLPEPGPDGVPFERYVPTWAPLISDVHGPITMSYCDAQGKFQTMILTVERLAGMMYSAHRILGKRMGDIHGQEQDGGTDKAGSGRDEGQ